tara:strand:+ start:3372 stop:5405 length:2034 start_codon:yes stop_codon:yes gene_type:complete
MEKDWESSIDTLFKTKNTKASVALKEAGIDTIEDLLQIFPSKIIPLDHSQKTSSLEDKSFFYGRGKIIKVWKTFPQSFSGHRKGKKGAIINAQFLYSGSGEVIKLMWFNAFPNLFEKIKVYEEESIFVYLKGFINLFKSKPQIISPSISNEEDTQSVYLEYPTINFLKNKEIKKVFDRIPDYMWDNIEETLPTRIILEKELPTKKSWAKLIHGKITQAVSSEDIAQAHFRTIYEKVFHQIHQNIKEKKEHQYHKSKNLSISLESLKSILKLFPFDLTTDQSNVVNEIIKDLDSSKPMIRLLQGDVGTGKTCIAIIASVIAIQNNSQVALMCPTESLAQQHFIEFKSILKSSCSIELLLGSQSQSHKNQIKKDLQNGSLDIIVGTHALIQESISFFNLGLAIIDEQQKFGVNQKNQLLEKAKGVHSLYISATPIPRDLKLAQYGKIDLSIIKTQPKNKKDIKTKIITESNFNLFLKFLKTRLSMGEQAYIVVPRIHSNNKDARNNFYLKNIFQKFKSLFPEYNVESFHGELSLTKKEDVFRKFHSGEISLLCATSIIEVGINVPNATTIAIFKPDCFGLSSLHQLRGRVGRGGKPGFCFIIKTKEITNDHSLKRIKTFEKYNDGFKIADEDLRLRGEGDIIGTKQSGLSPFKSLETFVKIDENFLYNIEQDVLKCIKY